MEMTKVALTSTSNAEDTEIILKLTAEDNQPITADVLIGILKKYVSYCEKLMLESGTEEGNVKSVHVIEEPEQSPTSMISSPIYTQKSKILEKRKKNETYH